jgi:hypothetical protein
MNDTLKREQPEGDRALQARLHLVGVAILVVGLLASVIVDAKAPPPDEGAYSDSRRYEYEMEQIGGKSNLLAAEIREWFGGLWHGKGLARLLACVSVGGSFGCFYLAYRMNHPVRRTPDAPRPRGGGQA